MSVSIHTGNNAIIARGNLKLTGDSLKKSIERLSSGFRINKAEDDGAGLMVSERLRSQIRGLTQGTMNAQNTTSLLQIADSSLSTISDMLLRMKELAIEAGDTSYTSADRNVLQSEIDALKNEINRISVSTMYNGSKLLTGDASALTSSTNSDVQGIITGVVAEGEYKLNIATTPGTNTIYKTAAMELDPSHYRMILSSTATGVTAIENLNKTDLSVTGILSYFPESRGRYKSEAITYKPATTTYKVENIDIFNTSTPRSGYWVLEVAENKTFSAANGYSLICNVTFIDAETGSEETTTVTFANLNSSDVNDQKVTVDIGGGATITAPKSGSNGFVDKGALYVMGVYAAKTELGIIIAPTGLDSTYKAVSTKVGFDYNAKSGTVYSLIVNTTNGSIEKNAFKVDWDPTLDITAITFTASGRQYLADEYTKLRDIAAFTDADGVSILSTTQELTLYNKDRQASIYLNSEDTIASLNAKLLQAVTDMGSGAKNSTDIANTVNQNLVIYSTSASSTLGAMGSFVIQTALTGEDSEIYLSGNEKLLNALALSTMKDAQQSLLTVTTTSSTSNSTSVVTDGVLRGVIKGVEVDMTNINGSTPYWDSTSSSVRFTALEPTTATLLVKDNSKSSQVGAYEGQKINFAIGRIDTTSLGINDVYVTNSTYAQKAITKLDQALDQVTQARAAVGAQINRLYYAVENNAVTRQNLIAADSHIREIDVAEESSAFLQKQMRMNAATAMLAQANTAAAAVYQLIR